MNEIRAIIDELLNDKFGHLFKDPVTEECLNDPVLWKAYDAKIPRKISLSEVQENIQRGKYPRFQDAANDIKLVFANAMIFNPEGNYYHEEAKRLNNRFEAKYADLCLKRAKPRKKHKKSSKKGQTLPTQIRADVLAYRKTTVKLREDYQRAPQEATHKLSSKSTRQKCIKVLQILCKEDAKKWFSVPVSLEAFPTYSNFVSTPMDLSVVKKKVKSKGANGYKTTADFARDIRQIFINCDKFNIPGDDVQRVGEHLSVVFERHWKDCLADISSEMRQNSDTESDTESDTPSVPLPRYVKSKNQGKGKTGKTGKTGKSREKKKHKRDKKDKSDSSREDKKARKKERKGKRKHKDDNKSTLTLPIEHQPNPKVEKFKYSKSGKSNKKSGQKSKRQKVSHKSDEKSDLLQSRPSDNLKKTCLITLSLPKKSDSPNRMSDRATKSTKLHLSTSNRSNKKRTKTKLDPEMTDITGGEPPMLPDNFDIGVDKRSSKKSKSRTSSKTRPYNGVQKHDPLNDIGSFGSREIICLDDSDTTSSSNRTRNETLESDMKSIDAQFRTASTNDWVFECQEILDSLPDIRQASFYDENNNDITAEIRSLKTNLESRRYKSKQEFQTALRRLKNLASSCIPQHSKLDLLVNQLNRYVVNHQEAVDDFSDLFSQSDEVNRPNLRTTPPAKTSKKTRHMPTSDYKKCLKAHLTLYKNDFTSPLCRHFDYAVDPVRDKVPRYFDRVKKPMDLSLCKDNLEKGVYLTKDEFLTDLRLVFQNCISYHGETDALGITARMFLNEVTLICDLEFEKKPRNRERFSLLKCQSILHDIMYMPNAKPFVAPVNPNLYEGIADYFQRIPNPMDFSTIKRKLAGHLYNTNKDFFDDMMRTFNNCQDYHPFGSDLYNMAQQLKDELETRARNAIPDIYDVVEESPANSIDQLPRQVSLPRDVPMHPQDSMQDPDSIREDDSLQKNTMHEEPMRGEVPILDRVSVPDEIPMANRVSVSDDVSVTQAPRPNQGELSDHYEETNQDQMVDEVQMKHQDAMADRHGILSDDDGLVDIVDEAMEEQNSEKVEAAESATNTSTKSDADAPLDLDVPAPPTITETSMFGDIGVYSLQSDDSRTKIPYGPSTSLMNQSSISSFGLPESSHVGQSSSSQTNANFSDLLSKFNESNNMSSSHQPKDVKGSNGSVPDEPVETVDSPERPDSMQDFGTSRDRCSPERNTTTRDTSPEKGGTFSDDVLPSLPDTPPHTSPQLGDSPKEGGYPGLNESGTRIDEISSQPSVVPRAPDFSDGLSPERPTEPYARNFPRDPVVPDIPNEPAVAQVEPLKIKIGKDVQNFDEMGSDPLTFRLFYPRKDELDSKFPMDIHPTGTLRVENPRAETTIVETPSVEIPRVEIPRVGTPTLETPRVENPRLETPRVETPRVDEFPRIETPRVDEFPRIETPRVDEFPRVSTPKVSTPRVDDSPRVDTPTIEAPRVDITTTEASTDETPQGETLPDETRSNETPTAETPTDETTTVETRAVVTSKVETKHPKSENELQSNTETVHLPITDDDDLLNLMDDDPDTKTVYGVRPEIPDDKLSHSVENKPFLKLSIKPLPKLSIKLPNISNKPPKASTEPLTSFMDEQVSKFEDKPPEAAVKSSENTGEALINIIDDIPTPRATNEPSSNGSIVNIMDDDTPTSDEPLVTETPDIPKNTSSSFIPKPNGPITAPPGSTQFSSSFASVPTNPTANDPIGTNTNGHSTNLFSNWRPNSVPSLSSHSNGTRTSFSEFSSDSRKHPRDISMNASHLTPSSSHLAPPGKRKAPPRNMFPTEPPQAARRYHTPPSNPAVAPVKGSNSAVRIMRFNSGNFKPCPARIRHPPPKKLAEAVHSRLPDVVARAIRNRADEKPCHYPTCEEIDTMKAMTQKKQKTSVANESAPGNQNQAPVSGLDNNRSKMTFSVNVRKPPPRFKGFS